MILFFLIALPTATLFGLPSLVSWLTGRQARASKLLVIAAVVSMASWALPSPVIDGANTQFMVHVVGGGIYSGFVWAWLLEQLRLDLSFPMRALSLFALTSALGVAIELFELAVVLVVPNAMGLTDTSWDLLANTTGAALFFAAWSARAVRRRSHLPR